MIGSHLQVEDHRCEAVGIERCAGAVVPTGPLESQVATLIRQVLYGRLLDRLALFSNRCSLINRWQERISVAARSGSAAEWADGNKARQVLVLRAEAVRHP